MASSSSADAEGPVLSLVAKRLRALKKKYNRILQMEETLALGKPLNKEQEEVLRSKTAVAALIDEYEKLRQPLAVAVQEELAKAPAAPPAPAEDVPDGAAADRAVEDLVTLLYFGCLFDVKPQSEFTAMMLTRAHERGCCLTYDYVGDDATEMLRERDLDAISALGSLVTSRFSGLSSHKGALQGCVEHAKLWLQNADQAISPGDEVTYAGIREKLKKILASDFFTTTAELKAPDDVAAAVGNYGAAPPEYVSENTEVPLPEDETEDVANYTPEEQEEQGDFQGTEHMPDDQSKPIDESAKMDETEELNSFIEVDAARQEQQKHEADFEEQDQRDLETKDNNYNSRGSYPNQRGGYRGGNRGRRGYSNGRGGRGNRGGNGGYQNGRSQYNDSGYYPRNYYNSRGRGGRSGGSGTYYNNNGNGGGSYGGHASEAVGA